MASAAILDFIKVPFLRHGWADSHQIWYAGAERHPVISVAKIIILQKKMAVAALPSWILEKTAITSLRVDVFR